MKGIISGIKRMEIHDGAGLRTTVFFKGCPMRCIWCHNPESLSFSPQIAKFEQKCVSCGACGGEDGQLYLLWGQNKEKDLSHYELYRSEQEGFTPCPENFVANVDPGEYTVVPYEDKGLKTHCCYYYRVRAVNRKGLAGEYSCEFSAVTREMI